MKKIAIVLSIALLISCASEGGDDDEKSLYVAMGNAGKDDLSAIVVKGLWEGKSEEEFQAQTHKKYSALPLKPFMDSINHARFSFKEGVPPYEVYEDTQVMGIAQNMVALQNPDGGWKKNIDWVKVNTIEELEALREGTKEVEPVTYEKISSHEQSTIDNSNIYSQIDYLAHVYSQVSDESLLNCIQKALGWIFNAEHPVSGGWTGSDVGAVTYNDSVMTGVLDLLREVTYNDSLYGFLPKSTRSQAKKAYDRGIKCVLDTQIKIKGPDGKEVLSAWAQQYDHETLKPIWARTFEPPAITASESSGILKMLMRDANPSPQMKAAINSAAAWFSREDIIIKGKKIVRNPAPEEISSQGKWTNYEQVMVDDAAAPDLWARFYDIDTLKPLWCDRERVFCDTFNDMSKERRNGYAYTGRWPVSALAEYDEWVKIHGSK